MAALTRKLRLGAEILVVVSESEPWEGGPSPLKKRCGQRMGGFDAEMHSAPPTPSGWSEAAAAGGSRDT